jgi:hypothetical protein
VADASGKLELRLDLSGFSPLLIVLVLELVLDLKVEDEDEFD